MLLARPVLPHGGRVAGRDVADVAREAVARVERVQPPHHAVARHLRDDRGGRDRRALRVAVDDGAVLGREGTEPEPVDEAGLGGRRQVGEDGAERPEVRAVQAVPVDVGARDDADADPRRAADHCAEELLALLRRDLLGVVQGRERPHPMVAEALVVEQDARDDERPRERAATRLVGARDEARTEPAIEREELLTGRARHDVEDRGRCRRNPSLWMNRHALCTIGIRIRPCSPRRAGRASPSRAAASGRRVRRTSRSHHRVGGRRR